MFPLNPLSPDLRRAVETALQHARRHQAAIREAQRAAARAFAEIDTGDVFAKLNDRHLRAFLAQMDQVRTEGMTR